MGDCGSGKTSLFYQVTILNQLTQDQLLETVSSIQINQAKLNLNNASYTLIDLPGHSHFKSSYFIEIN